MRRSKYVGFLGICLGLLVIVAPAVLPVSPATQRLGPFRVNVRSDSCGPAAYVAFRKTGTECGLAAEKRLLATTAVGLLLLATGMAVFAGPEDARGSRVDVPTLRLTRRLSRGAARTRAWRR